MRIPFLTKQMEGNVIAYALVCLWRERLPVYGHPIISLVVNIDKHSIPFVNPYYWPWKTAINNQHALCAT
jgi:hypothetical protein